MLWLEALDRELFRFVNLKLANPVFDQVMPFLSGNRYFFPALAALAILLVWKGRSRGVVLAVMLALTLAIGDGFICRTLKGAVGRPRPYVSLPGTRRPDLPGGERPASQASTGQATGGRLSESSLGDGRSMPSSHAANWFGATMVALIYYRRSLWFMLPAAMLVSFSRVYNGVHYPSDVLVGAILGAGYAGAIVWSVEGLWQWAGRKWFPLWWPKLPSLLALELRLAGDAGLAVARAARLGQDAQATAPQALGQDARGADNGPKAELQTAGEAPQTTVDRHWLRLGYICVAVLLLARWAYIASGTIQLSKDESYQWLWSKHLALSYYSKPALIAWTQFLGTTLWGDNEFGVRFFSPLLSAVQSLLLLRFFAREANARAGFFLVLMATATPILAVGSVLMTVDPLSVFFWTLAMLAGWRAIRDDATTADWRWVGLWMGLGFLSKYTALFQWLCWAVFFALWRPARRQLRRPGPYVALAVNLLCALPVLIWNAQHGWVTIGHVAGDAKVGEAWEPTLKFLVEFLGSEFGLLNPVFFVGMVWAAVAFWRRGVQDPRQVYFLSMGAPLFLAYLLWTLHSRVLPNWIAPSILPLFCLTVVYWDTRWRLGREQVKRWLYAGLGLGLPLVILGHDNTPVAKLLGRPLPVKLDVLHRARGWDDVARVVGQARQSLLTEGKPVFIIAADYSLAGEISFYLPEAKAAVSGTPLVYCLTSATPQNQFYFWPGYAGRRGENAIFVRELDRDRPDSLPPPDQLEAEFESVKDVGVARVLYHNRDLLWPLQLIECRGLRRKAKG